MIGIGISITGGRRAVAATPAPVNTVAPVVSGDDEVGSELACTTGMWTGTPTGYAYQWTRDAVAIDGETADTYTTAEDDIGADVGCTVTASNDAGSASANSNTVTVVGIAPVNTVAPVASGSAPVGATLSCTTGTWTGTPTPTYGYQWQRNGVDIGGATANTHVTVSADVGLPVRCVVTGTNVAGSASANSNAITVTAAPVNTVAPVASGTVAVGLDLTTTNGTWTGYAAPTFTYQWQRGGVDIGSATAATHTCVAADIGASITCNVTATNSAGNATQASNAKTYSLAALATWAGAIFAIDGGHYHVDGSLTDSLTDQSGNGLDAAQTTDASEMTPVAADTNLNNRPTFSTDNARFYETAATADVSSAYTAVSVVRPSTLKNWDGIFRLGLAGMTGTAGTAGFSVFAASDGKLWWSAPGASDWTWITAAGEIASDTNYVVTVKTTSAGGANRFVRKNGTDITANGTFGGSYAHPSANRVVAPGGGFTNSNSRLDGTLAAQMLVPTSLSDANCLVVERTLGAYYAITVA